MSLVKIRKLAKQEIGKFGNGITNKRIILGALTDSTLVNVPKYLKDISVECYHPCFTSILDKKYIKAIKAAGIKVNTYTVNKEKHMKMVIKAGADSIITNEVEKLNKILNI